MCGCVGVRAHVVLHLQYSGRQPTTPFQYVHAYVYTGPSTRFIQEHIF